MLGIPNLGRRKPPPPRGGDGVGGGGGGGGGTLALSIWVKSPSFGQPLIPFPKGEETEAGNGDSEKRLRKGDR